MKKQLTKNLDIKGVILIIVGSIFFLNNFLGISIIWSYIWPLILIGLGVWLIMKNK